MNTIKQTNQFQSALRELDYTSVFALESTTDMYDIVMIAPEISANIQSQSLSGHSLRDLVISYDESKLELHVEQNEDTGDITSYNMLLNGAELSKSTVVQYISATYVWLTDLATTIEPRYAQALYNFAQSLPLHIL